MKHFSTRRIRIIGLLSVLILVVIVSSLLYNAIIGQLAILLYGVYALIRRIPSDTTLKIALITFAVVMVLSIFNLSEDDTLPDTFAVYGLLLLMVWAISRLFERNISQKGKKVM